MRSFTRKDFDVIWFSGQGGGGQHRNKHRNCCRIVHRETGISAQSTKHKEREYNKRAAFRVLASRLREHYLENEVVVRTKTEEVRVYKEGGDVVDHLSGERASFKVVVEKGNIRKLIEARVRARGDESE